MLSVMEIRLAGAYEVSAHLGISKQRVHQLAGSAGFPAPVAVLHAGAIWDLNHIDQWRKEARPISNDTPRVPPRDPERPKDDPWDADAVRYLMQFTSRRRGWLMEHLRGQPRLGQSNVEAARALAKKHGVEWRCHIDGTTVHFFRTDRQAPTPYPASEAERREWRSGAGS